MRTTIWRWRHWFDRGAFFGAVMSGYNTLIAIIGIAPSTPSDLKWWLLTAGVALSFGTWWALADGNRRAEDDAALSEQRHAADLAASATVQTTLDAELPLIRSGIAALLAHIPPGSPDRNVLERAQRSIENIGVMRATLPMQTMRATAVVSGPELPNG